MEAARNDAPAGLSAQLEAAGFVAESRETVMIALADPVGAAATLPEGVRLHEVSERAELERIASLHGAVAGEDVDGLAARLEHERALDPEALVIVLAEAGGEAVCAGWMKIEPESEFATLWGGATLPAWRGRGIYRALVGRRAQLAARQGRRYVQVDALETSRPILARLGFVAVTTTPFVWSPRAER